jgi:hypothetical protein
MSCGNFLLSHMLQSQIIINHHNGRCKINISKKTLKFHVQKIS